MTYWTDMLGGEIRFRDANGVRTRSLEAGSGPPLIMMHARAGHAESYIKNVVPLGQHFHTYAIDLLLHGLNGPFDGEGSIPNMGEHVAGFLKTVGAPEAYFIGQAVGGRVATWLALEKPGLVKGLIWVTPASLPGDQEDWKGGRFPASVVPALDNPNYDTVRNRMKEIFANPELLTDEVIATRAAIYQQPGVADRIRRALHSEDRYSFHNAVLRKLAIPTLFIGADGANPEVAEQAAKVVPGAQHRLIKNSRIWPFHEHPEEFNKMVLDFLLPLEKK